MREEYKPRPGGRYDSWATDETDFRRHSVFRWMKFCDIKNVNVLRAMHDYDISSALNLFVTLKRPSLSEDYFAQEMDNILTILIENYYPVEEKWLKYSVTYDLWGLPPPLSKKAKKKFKWGEAWFG